MEVLQAAGVPAGMVAHARHHMEDPHLAARGYPRRVEQPGYGALVLEGSPLRGSALPEAILGPAPELGEHTREIAAEWLALSDAEIDAQMAAGVLEEPAPRAEEGPSGAGESRRIR